MAFSRTRALYLERTVVPFSDESLLFTGNERAWPFNTVAQPVPRGHVPSKEGDEGGRIFMQALMATVEAEGVLIKTDARVLGLIQDDSGRVRGVVARIDGEEVAIAATRGVILSAGGFVMNREMLEKHAAHTLPFGEPYGNQWMWVTAYRWGWQRAVMRSIWISALSASPSIPPPN